MRLEDVVPIVLRGVEVLGPGVEHHHLLTYIIARGIGIEAAVDG
jgi:hypothetical protein